MLFLPPCRVSTQWLSDSKWLARGGRRSRCVHFCAMHSQCLPKTVTVTHCNTLQHTAKKKSQKKTFIHESKEKDLMRSGVAKYRVSEQEDIGEHGRPLHFENEIVHSKRSIFRLLPVKCLCLVLLLTSRFHLRLPIFFTAFSSAWLNKLPPSPSLPSLVLSS